MRRLWGLLVAGLFAGFVVALTPHLVHHLFDADRQVAQHRCPLAAVAERQPGAETGAVVLAVAHGAGLVVTAAATLMLPAPALAAPEARAPPVAA